MVVDPEKENILFRFQSKGGEQAENYVVGGLWNSYLGRLRLDLHLFL